VPTIATWIRAFIVLIINNGGQHDKYTMHMSMPPTLKAMKPCMFMKTTFMFKMPKKI
jgi:hypothetical protein